MAERLDLRHALEIKNKGKQKRRAFWRKKAIEVAEEIAQDLVSLLEKEIREGKVYIDNKDRWFVEVEKKYHYPKPYDRSTDKDYFFDYCDVYEDQGEITRKSIVTEKVKEHFVSYGWHVDYWERTFSDYNTSVYEITVSLRAPKNESYSARI